MAEDMGIAAEACRLLQDTEVFAGLSQSARRRLASYAQERFFLPGELVLREGDLGEEFFLVASGSVHIIGRAFDGTNLIMARVTQGQVFGEQALMQGGSRVRNASARAAESCRLLIFPREALLEAQGADETVSAEIRAIGERQAAARRELLRDKLLQDIAPGARYEMQRYEKGQVVFREGDPPTNIYLILDGAARVRRGEGADAHILSELLPGQFFGELAILTNEPRSATVEATSALETAALDGAWFRTALAAQPKLQSLMESLQAMYLLPARGLITLQGGTLGSQPTLTSTYHLTDGRRVVATLITGLGAFSARAMGAPEATKSVRFTARDEGIMREIHVYRDQIVEIESEGPWEQLGAVLERLLDGGVIDDAELAAFEARGDFCAAQAPDRDQAEIVCRCARVTVGYLASMIAGGCNTFDKLAAKSMATKVCGGCVPTIKEFFGQAEWMSAVCDRTETLAPEIRMFRLRLLEGEGSPAIPGQHLILQARIGGRWIERPYTISSAPGTPRFYEVIVKRERQGLLSRWLFDSLDEGSALRVSPPRGSYRLDPSNSADVVILAGGIGITPGLAMARAYAAVPHKWHLHIDHSVSFEEQAICGQELRVLAARSAGLTFTLRVTRRDGRLNAAALEALKTTYPDGNFYVCGGSGYVESVAALLKQAGVASSHIRIELFSPVG
jgi:ferredoxin-NADP reductase/CRP-like cAMP-binding protein